jgi:hypothetical protein
MFYILDLGLRNAILRCQIHLILFRREENGLYTFENRVQRMITESQNEKETGWIKLHNEKFHNFYAYTYNTKNDQTKEDRMGRACNM